MKIKQEFKPITITIESQEELDTLMSLVNCNAIELWNTVQHYAVGGGNEKKWGELSLQLITLHQ